LIADDHAALLCRQATYNDIMTRSDKDFITRIQVSQLVTQDPYADDFYAQVYGAIIRSKLGAPNGSSSVIRLSKDGSGVGVGMPGQKGAGRKEGAMHKMALQVKRIVDAAKQRERAPADGTTPLYRHPNRLQMLTIAACSVASPPRGRPRQGHRPDEQDGASADALDPGQQPFLAGCA
jgi:hypothetical protein